MRRHERGIMRYLLRVTGNREDAADLFQETWLRAYGAYARLEPERDVRPWLYAIAVNLCRNHARDGARRGRVIVAEQPAEKERGKPHYAENENDGYASIHLRELMSKLPGRQREAVYLRYFAGFDFGSIAVTMGCSQDTARANVAQGMKKIKSMW